LLHYIPILLALNKKYILITTCNDDFCIPYFQFPQNNSNIVFYMEKLLEDPNLVRWFTKNPCISHTKLFPIPMGPKWQYTSSRFFGEDKQPILQILNTYCIEPEKKFKDTSLKTELLYFNFSIGTTDNPFITEHKDMRRQVETVFLSKNFVYNQSKHFEGYIKELSNYKFCLSPPGRGVDTHRTWEALMVGTIPIMFSSALDVLFEKLPVIIINDWNIIDESFLNEEYDKIHKKEYDFSILFSDYWKNKIAYCSLS